MRIGNKDDSPTQHQVDPENAPHVGGNTWAGGTGGRDTAGLGGKGGPYRLDAGHDIHQIPDWEKEAVPEEVSWVLLLCLGCISFHVLLQYSWRVAVNFR